MSQQLMCDCGAEIKVPAKLAGRTIRCRECGERIILPGIRRRSRSRPQVRSQESNGSKSEKKCSGSRSPTLPKQPRTQRRRRDSRRRVKQSSLNIPLIPLCSRLIGVGVMWLAGWIVYQRINSGNDQYMSPDDHKSHAVESAIGIAIFAAVGIPALYMIIHGIQFGPAASAARGKGVAYLLMGIGMAALGLLGMGLMLLIAAPFGVVLIQWGMLMPMVPAVAGLVNIITGVDIVATLEKDEKE